MQLLMASKIINGILFMWNRKGTQNKHLLWLMKVVNKMSNENCRSHRPSILCALIYIRITDKTEIKKKLMILCILI